MKLTRLLRANIIKLFKAIAKQFLPQELLLAISNRNRFTVNIARGNRECMKYGQPEASFITDDGSEIPVYQNYRYSLKPGWRSFYQLKEMEHLAQKGLLSVSVRNYLNSAIGKRTITVPLEEINEVYLDVVNKHKDLFTYSNGKYGLKPSLEETEKLIESFVAKNLELLVKLKKNNITIKENSLILEIGYTSGGHSLFAFERLGYNCVGIDNYYDGIIQEQSLHFLIKDMVQSNVKFYVEDITKTTSFQSGQFDLVFSRSVLEHVLDIQSAMIEMNRVLKVGGLMIHFYDPFFHPKGGHSLGILDSPWAHTRLNINEYLRYLKELRPYEYDKASDWIVQGLNRDYPMQKMQRLVVKTGFDLELWQSNMINSGWLSDLSTSVIKDSFAAYPEISLQDLIYAGHFFVARKNADLI